MAVTESGSVTGVRRSTPPQEILLDWYRQMVEIRLFEEQVDSLFAQGLIHGTTHLCIGQEASAVGAIAAIGADDYITSTHRGHGHCLAKGADLSLMMAELMGRATGYCHGKGGSMHIADLDVGNLGANGIVGGGIPVATGAALALKMQKRHGVVLCFFGDGATNQGTFHEAINMAAVWKLPVVFICENNQYGMSGSYKRMIGNPNIAERAVAYGIPGQAVDGNDVVAVYDAVGEAVERARGGEGPSLIECKTYRTKGHSKSDANRYRSREEIDLWRSRCPVQRLKGELLQLGAAAADLQAVEEAARQKLAEAVAFAQSSPEPGPETLMTDVYAESEEGESNA